MQPEILRILITIVLQKKWKICQWDVIAAYFQAPLQHTVYVINKDEAGETRYWKLYKALYGLKQAGHEWYNVTAAGIGGP